MKHTGENQRRQKDLLRYGLLLCLFLCLLGMTCRAEAVALVDDMANLLTSDEGQQLLSNAQELSSRYGYDVMLVTTEDAEGKEAVEYAEDYYLEHCESDDGFVFLIDMDNREMYLATSGAVIPYVTDVRREELLDDAYDQISEGNYARTFYVVLGDMRKYLQSGVVAGQYTENVDTGEIVYYQEPKELTGGELLIALVIGLGAGGILFATVNARYRMKSGGYRYDFHSNCVLKLSQKTDRLENRYVTRRHIPKSPPPSSGGGGSTGGGHTTVHTGSGGHTFGGGGRKF